MKRNRFFVKAARRAEGKKMVKKGFCFGVVIFVLLQSFVFLSCASIQPLSNEAIRKYTLAANPGNFKNFQYYVSRDIILTYITSQAHSTSIGQVSINSDIIQILSSTPGVVLDVRTDENRNTMLGVAFETDNDNLLWFVQNPNKAGTYFYLAYTNEKTGEIDYSGNSYAVSYEQAKGIGANNKRFLTPKKTKEGGYENMEPILLYEENVKVSEQRRNVKGRKL